MSRLDEIKARAEAATEGPWSFDWSEGEVPVFYGQTTKISGTFSVEANTIEDAAFIEASREDVPWLVEQVERLERWKVEAIEVMSGLRELGKALGLGLGVQITGPAALAEVARLTAERDVLAAQVARVEKLAGQWERLATTAINPDSREWLQACAKTLRECLSGWQKMHAALADSEADTSDTQPTDQEDQS